MPDRGFKSRHKALPHCSTPIPERRSHLKQASGDPGEEQHNGMLGQKRQQMRSQVNDPSRPAGFAKLPFQK
jgi:hypothetical protein